LRALPAPSPVAAASGVVEPGVDEPLTLF